MTEVKRIKGLFSLKFPDTPFYPFSPLPLNQVKDSVTSSAYEF